MDGGCTRDARPFRSAIAKWRAVGGGVEADGTVVTQPWPLVKAQLIDGLCQRYHCLPSALFQEDTHFIFQMLALLSDAEADGVTAPEGNGAMNDSTSQMLASLAEAST